MQTSDVLPSVALHPADIVDSIRGGAAAQHIVGADSNMTDNVNVCSVNAVDVIQQTVTCRRQTGRRRRDTDCEGERAGVIMKSNQISLDPRLAIFTVNGTSEPRVVRLFPTTTCS